jgi:hypothetical protein
LMKRALARPVLAICCSVLVAGALAPVGGADPSGPVGLDRVCADLPLQGMRDYTSPAGDALPADVPVGADGTPLGPIAVFYGQSAPFSEIQFLVDVPGIGGTVGWKYFNGIDWVNLAVADGTGHFASSGTVSFTPPSDWAPRTLHPDCADAFYYVKTITHKRFAAAPLAGQILTPP